MAKRKFPKVQLDAPVDPSQKATPWRIHLDATITGQQAHALRCLQAALEAQGATSDVGGPGPPRKVRSMNGALRWLLEQLHLAMQQSGAARQPTTTTEPPNSHEAPVRPRPSAD